MAVHIKNVPAQSTTDVLRKNLLPYLKKLSIRSYHCTKWGKSTNGSLTFLNVADAQIFLKHHGQLRRSMPVSPALYTQIKILGQDIFFEKSNRAADPFVVRGLDREQKERQLATSSGQPRPIKILPISFSTSSVSFGSWAYFDTELAYISHLTWNVSGTAKFGKRSMILVLDSGIRIDFRYSAIQTITTEDRMSPTLIFSMQEPPRFFEKIEDDPIMELISQLNIGDLVVPNDKGRKNGIQRYRLSSLSSKHEPISGNCLVYRITLVKLASITRGGSADTSDLLRNLKKAHEVPPMIYQPIDVYDPEINLAASFRLLYNALSSVNRPFPFEVAFQVQKLAQNNYLPPATALKLFPCVANIVRRSGVTVCVSAIRKSFNDIPFPAPDVEAENFELKSLEELLKANEKLSIKEGTSSELVVHTGQSSNVAIIHRVKVTPTGIHLSGPEPETSNRILRKYPANHDSFIRVQFCDEDGEPLKSTGRASNYRIFHLRFKEVLEKGIRIAERTYSFLGFSHSGLRMQSCWFVAPFIYRESLLDDRDIIQGLGNFTLIRCPAKCAARIAQSFTDTRIAVPIDPNIVREVEDVKFESRVFSDGVGTMSASIMAKVSEQLPKAHRSMPSVLQIRYRGAKGMVSLDSRLEGDVLNLRPSMVKFSGSTSNDIEICEASYKPLPVFLNRQFIKILEDMGVNDDYFLNLQGREVERLRLITDSPINASSFLKRLSIGEAIHLPWLINKLGMMGIDFKMDSFLCDVLEVAFLMELRMLKHKTRIPVPEGWHLHGVMDETGILEEDQIFCVGIEDGMRRVITGKNLVITRAPALHPGDIQLVEAIMPPPDSPLLKLSNCVCFSQKGKRDLPSQLSGGDLDGDRYYVIWDEELRPKRTFPPADYPRVPPVDIGRVVMKSDMTDFFIEFMETDQLGRIAVSHRVLADQREYGSLDNDCITLAELHSTAVDFSKTGIPADLSKMPKSSPWRPDFEAPGPHVVIEKFGGISFLDLPYYDPAEADDEDDDFTVYRYYESDRIIGKLYRAIDERKIFEQIKLRELNEGLDRSSSVIQAVWDYVRRTCKLIQWEHLKDWARDIRDMYEGCVLNIMSEYSGHPHRPLSELEAFVGDILGRTGTPTRHQRELSVSMKEKFEEDSNSIVNFILKDGIVWSEESLERSMACLAVSLEDQPIQRGNEQLLSFKYVAAAVCLREVERIF